MKRELKFQNPYQTAKVKNMKHVVSSSFYNLAQKMGHRHLAKGLVHSSSGSARQIIFVLFGTKYPVPCVKLLVTIRSGQKNLLLSSVFIFASCEEKGYYCAQLRFDCHSYCEWSYRMRYNWTEWSTVQGVIMHVISKLDKAQGVWLI